MFICNFGFNSACIYGRGVSQTANAENEVIEISSATQLQEVANNVNEGNNDYAGITISLSWDIELTQSWTPIGTVGRPFRGTLMEMDTQSPTSPLTESLHIKVCLATQTAQQLKI